MRTKLILLAFSSWFLAFSINSCKSEKQLNYERYYAYGKTLYEQHCQNCHGAEGQGLNALIPPLTDTLFLKKNRDQLGCIIKNGLTGKITVNRREFDGLMPGNTTLSPIDIAEIVTYVTNSFGNGQGIYEGDKKCN